MKQFWMIALCALALSQTGIAADVYYQPPQCTYPPQGAMCWNGIYLKGFGGYNGALRPSWKSAKYRTNSGYIVGGALGTSLNFFNLEGEFSYRNNKISHLRIDSLDVDVSGHIEQWCGFANAIIDVPVCPSISPYAGVGVGYRHIKPGVNFDERSDRSFDNFIKTRDEWGVYQVIAGIKVLPISNFNILAEYRYMDGWANNKCANHSACAAAVVCF